ncbi:dipicolinic acid synthetase subunit A [Alkalibacillus haloalkaliphilus]|uniref:dipicolinic acid synthetase subunit A n=1 Tax=Alkalibacillus haloalkaliphilus TaxID=94136 RepID=UPI002936BB2F|nr:dipicolinic acid synthetase subunit A [Alkalibacillus haloalkaliphilus]MDV2580653.1 dipicolinic acid synthetase subunit A [Alkalibacillus haloalkaliphilus]
MLTGKSVLIVGGDARYIELIKQLSLFDASVYAIGFDEAEGQLENVILTTEERLVKDQIDAIILPITGLDQDGYADTHFSDSSIQLTEEQLNEFPDHCLMFTGIMTPYLRQLSSFQERIVALMDRDDVAIYNSIPTVEGAIMLAIQHTDFTIHNSNVTILGFGRVGKTLVRPFQGLGANVSVYARKNDDLARVFESHAKPLEETDLVDSVKDCNILINTVPDLIVTPKIISALPVDCLIIDLASKPGGVDFRYAKKRGINAMLAPSLPGMVAPKTAGKILAHVIQTVMHDHE